jgi:hypothetical protein
MYPFRLNDSLALLFQPPSPLHRTGGRLDGHQYTFHFFRILIPVLLRLQSLLGSTVRF